MGDSGDQLKNSRRRSALALGLACISIGLVALVALSAPSAVKAIASAVTDIANAATLRNDPAAPSSQTGAKPFRFMKSFGGAKSSAPARWPSCQKLVLLVDTTGMPADAHEAIDRAAQELAAATKLAVSVEYTDHIDSDRLPRGVIPIRWVGSDSGACNKLGDQADTLACTYINVVQVPLSGSQRIGTAEMYVYTDRDVGAWHAVILHELGHAVGLDHVEDKRQIMYPTVGRVDQYAGGDLAGLKIAGQAPCN